MDSIEPSKENRKKFDIDLEYGKVREKQVADMLQDKKIGKPSGIAATESDYWFHNLCVGDETFCTLVFDVNSLKKIIDKLDTKKWVAGGDNKASKMYLVSLQKLFSSDVIKTFKGVEA